MKQRTSVTLFVALALLIALPAGAFAQVDAPQTHAPQDPYSDMVTAVTNTTVQTDNLRGHHDLREDRIRFVDANDHLTDENRVEFDQTLERHRADTRTLRDTIRQNEVLTGTLDHHHVRVDDVVGVNVADDGWVTVYHRPRM